MFRYIIFFSFDLQPISSVFWCICAIGLADVAMQWRLLFTHRQSILCIFFVFVCCIFAVPCKISCNNCRLNRFCVVYKTENWAYMYYLIRWRVSCNNTLRCNAIPTWTFVHALFLCFWFDFHTMNRREKNQQSFSSKMHHVIRAHEFR